MNASSSENAILDRENLSRSYTEWFDAFLTDLPATTDEIRAYIQGLDVPFTSQMNTKFGNPDEALRLISRRYIPTPSVYESKITIQINRRSSFRDQPKDDADNQIIEKLNRTYGSGNWELAQLQSPDGLPDADLLSALTPTVPHMVFVKIDRAAKQFNLYSRFRRTRPSLIGKLGLQPADI